MNKNKIHIYYDNEVNVEYIFSDGQILTSPIGWQEKIKSLSKNKNFTSNYIGDRVIYEYEELVVQIDSIVQAVNNCPAIKEYIGSMLSGKIKERVKTMTAAKVKANKKTVETKDTFDYKPLVGSVEVDTKEEAKYKTENAKPTLEQNINIVSNVMPPRIVTRKNKYSNGKIVAGILLLMLLIGKIIQLAWVDEKKIATDYSPTDIDIVYQAPQEEYVPEVPPLETLGITSVINENVYLSYEDRTQDEKAIQTRNMYGNLIEKNAKKCGIDPRIVLGIATQESGDHEYGLRNGSTGGLMQIEIDYWRDEEITYYDFDDKTEYTLKITDEIIKDVDNNILIGCAILQNELKIYNYNILIAIQGYNMGYSNMSKILNETSKKTGLTKIQIINNNCYDWIKYTNVVDAGDPNYLNNVLSYTGFGYEVYDFYCKTPDGQIKTCTTLPITSVNKNKSEIVL